MKIYYARKSYKQDLVNSDDFRCLSDTDKMSGYNRNVSSTYHGQVSIIITGMLYLIITQDTGVSPGLHIQFRRITSLKFQYKSCQCHLREQNASDTQIARVVNFMANRNVSLPTPNLSPPMYSLETQMTYQGMVTKYIEAGALAVGI